MDDLTWIATGSSDGSKLLSAVIYFSLFLAIMAAAHEMRLNNAR